MRFYIINKDKSPFVNGKRNENFIPPHFRSQIAIGGERDYSQDIQTKKNFENEKKESNKIVAVKVRKVAVTPDAREENKSRNQILNDDNDLVCNNCLNRSMVEMKIYKAGIIKKEYDNEEKIGNLRGKHVREYIYK